jgi:hypothetical protein
MDPGAAISGAEPLVPGSVLTGDVAALDFGDCVSGQTFTRALRVRNAGDTRASGLSGAVEGAQGRQEQ